MGVYMGLCLGLLKAYVTAILHIFIHKNYKKPYDAQHFIEYRFCLCATKSNKFSIRAALHRNVSIVALCVLINTACQNLCHKKFLIKSVHYKINLLYNQKGIDPRGGCRYSR